MKRKSVKARAATKAKELCRSLFAKALAFKDNVFLRAAIGAIALMYLMIQGPQLHYQLIRGYVGSHVYYVTNEAGNSGGTGSHITAPSGKVYLITNSHVCGLAKDGVVWVGDGNSRPLPKRVIEDSAYTDLCLVEPMEGATGLHVASSVSIGEIVAAVGHPRLQPITMTRGEIVAEGNVTILDFVVSDDQPAESCSLPKQRLETVTTDFFGIPIEVQVCLVDTYSYLTTITALGGSSGSPVVNWKGQVVGLVFSGDNKVYWSNVVHLDDLKEFLKPY